MKLRAKDFSDAERMEILDALYTAAGTVNGRDATKAFLRDLLTESERLMLGRRILVARALIAGESYPDIAERMRVGYDTIRRIERWLEDKIPGYEEAVDGLTKEMERRREKRMYAQSALYRLKKKYPLYFLLFPWPKDPKGEE